MTVIANGLKVHRGAMTHFKDFVKLSGQFFKEGLENPTCVHREQVKTRSHVAYRFRIFA